MPMVCPQCKGSFETGVECPRCKVRLVPASEAREAEAPPPDLGPSWPHTPWARILVGLVLVLGIDFGLVHLGRAVLQGLGRDSAPAALNPLTLLLLLAAVQALVLVLTGVLVGAGQRRGFAFGAVVGLLSGAVLTGGLLTGSLVALVGPLFDLPVHPPSTHLAILYALPAAHVLFGGLGGLLGGWWWKPLPLLSLPSPAPAGAGPQIGTSASLARTRPQEPLFPWAGPVDWIRVMVGVIVAIGGGVLGTRPVIDFLVQASEGYFTIQTHTQEQVTTAEVFALSILLGGCLAGATRPNGLKQGLCVGIGSGVLMIAIFLASSTTPFAGTVLSLVISAVVLAPLGGWFGTELMPPALGAARPRRRSGWFG